MNEFPEQPFDWFYLVTIFFTIITATADQTEKKSDSNNIRRKRIDHILNTINFEIENEKLNKLIEVIDLDNQFKGKTTIEQIFSLQ